MRVPFDRANTLSAELVQAEPLTVPLDVPELGPIEITVGALTATAREVKLRQGAADKIRIAMQLDIRDGDEPVTTLAVVAEVLPVLERKDGSVHRDRASHVGVRLAPELVRAGFREPQALRGAKTDR